MHRLGAGHCYAALVVLFLAIGGCSDSTGLDRDARDVAALDIVADGQRISITNRTRKPVFMFVVGRQLAASIDWAACVTPACQPLAPGETRHVPYPSERIPDVEAEALVYWWHAASFFGAQMGYDRVRSEIVAL